MEELRVSIVTPEGIIFDQGVSNITLPGADGEFGVYPDHCSMISLLKIGVIEIVFNNQEKEYVAIDWGYARIDGEKVDILANGAVAITQGGEIAQNIEKAKILLQRASTDDLVLSGALSKLDCLTRR